MAQIWLRYANLPRGALLPLPQTVLLSQTERVMAFAGGKMKQWYFDYDGRRVGPLDHEQAVTQARQEPSGLVWHEGLPNWVPIRKVDELSPASAGAAAPPPVNTRRSDEIDYRIVGESTQFIEIELDPGESAIAEAGAMMYKAPSIELQTVFGDGSTQQSGGFFSKLVGAGKRLLTGESLFMTVFTHNGSGKAHVAFAAPYPGTVIPVELSSVDGMLICQKDSFLCAAKGVSVGIHFQQKILTGLFGGEGFIMQKLEGDGMVFVHAGGTVVERTLRAGETLHVDTGCVVAFERSVEFDIERVGGVKTMLFGGEGIFLATLQGPGRVWLQSLPFSRLAGRMLAAAPQVGGSRGEGSVLGGIGLGALMGDE